MLGVGDVDYMDPNISATTPAATSGCGCGAGSCSPTPPRTGATTTSRARPGHRDATAGNGASAATARPTRSRSRRRQVEHLAGASGDGQPTWSAASSARATRSQPFGGLPDSTHLIVGIRRSATVSQGRQHGGRDLGLHEQDRPPGRRGQGRPHRGLQADAPGRLLPRHAHPAAFSPAPKEYDAYVPASAELGQHTISDGPYKIESYAPTKNITFSATPPGRRDRPDPQGVRRQDRRSTRRSPRTPPSSS